MIRPFHDAWNWRTCGVTEKSHPQASQDRALAGVVERHSEHCVFTTLFSVMAHLPGEAHPSQGKVPLVPCRFGGLDAALTKFPKLDVTRKGNSMNTKIDLDNPKLRTNSPVFWFTLLVP